MYSRGRFFAVIWSDISPRSRVTSGDVNGMGVFASDVTREGESYGRILKWVHITGRYVQKKEEKEKKENTKKEEIRRERITRS